MEPFLGEIMITSFGFAPQGWATCDGQVMSIQQNQALYALLGTTYGGNGTTTFALPQLQGRVPLGSNATFQLGHAGGEAGHILNTNEIPLHTHSVLASNTDANQPSPQGNVWAKGTDAYQTGAGNTNMNASAVSCTGGGQAHPNMQPYLVLNFVIAIMGIFPSRD